MVIFDQLLLSSTSPSSSTSSFTSLNYINLYPLRSSSKLASKSTSTSTFKLSSYRKDRLNYPTRVHRFSNLYGTILYCQDYLKKINQKDKFWKKFSKHQDLVRKFSTDFDDNFDPIWAYNNGHHHHGQHHRQQQQQLALKQQKQWQNYPRLFDVENENGNFRNKPKHHWNRGTIFENVTFEWQVRSTITFQNGKRISTQEAMMENGGSRDDGSFQKAFDQNSLRSINNADGSMILAPFDSSDFVPEIHDVQYRCVLHLPNRIGSIASEEIHIQAVNLFIVFLLVPL
ncbi:hypothetical protein QR98_0091010 [Sarcoptes scabiei]|nr:hypothetical protein QR98_0091010 [Sarcoptes scabiei]